MPEQKEWWENKIVVLRAGQVLEETEVVLKSVVPMLLEEAGRMERERIKGVLEGMKFGKIKGDESLNIRTLEARAAYDKAIQDAIEAIELKDNSAR